MGVVPAVILAALVLAVLIVIQHPHLEEERFHAEAVASSESFIDATNDRDVESARALLAGSAQVSMNPIFGLDELEMGMAWFEATGWVMASNGCSVTRRLTTPTEGPIHVVCRLNQENAWSQAEGLDPETRGTLAFDVVSGNITTALLSFAPMSYGSELVSTFENWLEEAHPDDWDEMYVYEGLPALTPESIRLWSRRTDEFVQAHQGRG